MNGFTITPILDEEDSTPVFELKYGEFSSNFVTLENAFDFIRDNIQPVMTLENMAKNWIIAHGTNIFDDMQEDVEGEFEFKFTDTQWGRFTDLIAYSKITVEFTKTA